MQKVQSFNESYIDEAQTALDTFRFTVLFYCISLQRDFIGQDWILIFEKYDTPYNIYIYILPTNHHTE